MQKFLKTNTTVSPEYVTDVVDSVKTKINNIVTSGNSQLMTVVIRGNKRKKSGASGNLALITESQLGKNETKKASHGYSSYIWNPNMKSKVYLEHIE